jgi:hypothetical protein
VKKKHKKAFHLLEKRVEELERQRAAEQQGANNPDSRGEANDKAIRGGIPVRDNPQA